MSSDPDLSLIVLAYRSEDVILECLDSVHKQETRHPFEIIVINSFPDLTAELVQKNYPDIKLINSSVRLFPGSARNRGIAAASGKIIAFLASDCTLAPDWIELRVQQHRKGFSCVGGLVHLAPTMNPISRCEHWIEYSNFMLQKKPSIVRDETPHNLSYAKEIFEKYGCFNEMIRAGEDSLFNKKLVEAQEKIIVDPSIFMYHRGSRSFPTFNKHMFSHGKEITRFLALDADNKWNNFSRIRQLLSLSFILVIKRIFTIYRRIFRKGVREFLLGLLYAPLLFTGMCVLSYGALSAFFSKRIKST